MMRVGLAQVEGPRTESVVAELVRRCRLRFGETSPQAGIVLAATEFDHHLMLDRIRREFPDTSLIGCTTAGEFSTAHGFSEDSMALMMLGSDRVRIGVGAGKDLSKGPGRAAREAVAMAEDQLGASNAGLCVALAEGVRHPFDTPLAHLNQALPHGCPVFGGCAARLDEASQPVRQFFNNEVLEDALTLLLFSDPVDYLAAVANSWHPIGQRDVVTGANGPTVERIGDMNALDFYFHYLGEHEQPAIDFPLAVCVGADERVAMRGPVAYDFVNRTVTFAVAIPVGARVQLTEASRRFILDDTRRSAGGLADRLQDLRPAFGLAFSCFLRKQALGTRTAEELMILAAPLPVTLPLMGFYGYGEMGPLSRGEPSVFHNATLMTLLVGERGDQRALQEDAAENAGIVTARKLLEDGEVPCDLTRTEALECKIEYLQRRLKRSERARRRLEDIKELNTSLYRKVLEEAIEAREKIRRQEAELGKSEEKYRRIIETTGQGFLMMDKDLFIIDCNPAGCRLLGYSREELIGRRPIDLMPPSYQDFFIYNRNEILAQEQRELEAVVITRDGRTLPILIHGNTLRDADGALLGHIAFVTDMTAQKKALLLASEVQRGLLPKTPPHLPGLDIFGKSVPCDEVGGDYFDFLYGEEYPNHPFSLVVGDVTGHGVEAALLMSSARAFLRMRASQPGTMAEVITSLNRHLSLDVLESGRFMGLFYMCIGPDNRFIRWVRAGLDPALIYWRQRDAFEELMGEGMVLGLDEQLIYKENTLSGVDSEAIVLIGTDGIWEARGINGDMFGKARFKETVRRHADRPAEAIVSEVFAALDEFSVAVPPQDDRTLVVVKVTPMQ